MTDRLRCPRCGASNPADADWCSLCLERFTEPTPPPPAPAEQPQPLYQRGGRTFLQALWGPGWTVERIMAFVGAGACILAGMFVVGIFLLTLSGYNFLFPEK